MSIKKPFEGLPIEVLDGDRVLVDGQIRKREYFREYADELVPGPYGAMLALASREILRLMDEFEEPAPKWERCPFETGMVIRHKADGRLVLLGNARPAKVKDVKWTWETTDLSTGEVHWFDLHSKVWEIHRLPHEFKVGDWAQWIDHTSGSFKIMNIQLVDGREMLYGIGAFLPAEECRHVPPPKDSLSGNKTSEKPDPLQGPQWDAIESDSLEIYASVANLSNCVCDLREELRRVREGK